MASLSASPDASGIIWGLWSQLPSGKWHREGQDSSGNSYEDNQDEDPRQSYPQASLDSGGNDRVSMGRHRAENKHTAIQERPESSYRASDRGKGVRSPKGSRSSRLDVKGKGSQDGTQPVHLTTADDEVDDASPGGKHTGLGVETMAQKSLASSAQTPSAKTSSSYTLPLRTSSIRYTEEVERLDQHDASDFQDSLQDVSDIYSGGKSKESSFSSNSILGPGCYAIVKSHKELDGVPDLPRKQSHLEPSRRRTLQGFPHHDEDLSRFVVEPSRRFPFGTVFQIIWPESTGNTQLPRQDKAVETSTSVGGSRKRDSNSNTVYEDIRWFIVIDGNENGARNGNSICVPISTYKKQACTKRGVKPRHHGVIHTHDKQVLLLNDEPELGVAPIRLVVNSNLQGSEKLAPESRVNYGKHITVEHNNPVHIIGKINQEDLETLEQAVDTLWKERVRDRKQDKRPPKSARGEKHTSYPINEGTSRFTKTPPNLPEPHAPDRMRLESHHSDHKPDEHSKRNPRPTLSRLGHHRDKGAQKGDDSSLLQTVGKKSAVIQKEAQEPHVSVDSHVTVSSTQALPKGLFLRIVSYATDILQGRTHVQGEIGKIFQGEGTQAYAELPSNQTHRNVISLGAGNNTIQSSSGTGQPTPIAKKRKVSDEKEGGPQKGKEKEQLFGCPFVKRYGPKARCNNSGWPTTARVKEHLYRQHRQHQQPQQPQEPQEPQVSIHCPRCFTTFKDQEALNTHRKDQMILCDTAMKVSIGGFNEASLGGFDEDQGKKLKSRKGLSLKSEEEKWQCIYNILFPNEQGDPPSPYFDPRDFNEPLPGHKRQKIAQLIADRIKEELKAELGEVRASDLTDLLFKAANRALDEAADAKLLQNDEQKPTGEPMGGNVKDIVGKDVTKALENGSTDAHNKHYNGEGHGVAAKDSAMQSSCQIGTSVVPPDDYHSMISKFLTAREDKWEDFLVKELRLLVAPKSNPGRSYVAADPGYQQDTGIDKDTLVDFGTGLDDEPVAPRMDNLGYFAV